ncbi:hypothetical protein HT031_002014 [Scenedesmus sp. PABB004]|nr:hypothetical protein HT031_002014 [Scenedesmus sp. PABB004]
MRAAGSAAPATRSAAAPPAAAASASAGGRGARARPAAAAAAASADGNGNGRAAALSQEAEVFVCPEESLLYSQCIEKLVLSRRARGTLRRGLAGQRAQRGARRARRRRRQRPTRAAAAAAPAPPRRPGAPARLVEFGAGDGGPVLAALARAPRGRHTVHAYELGGQAAALAAARAASAGLADEYVARARAPRTARRRAPPRSTGAARAGLAPRPRPRPPPLPPLPGADADILMPDLWGGPDGAGLTRQLLSTGFDTAMLMVSAVSNPAATLRHAAAEGYAVADFAVAPLAFGRYSSEPKVSACIAVMARRGEAFYSEASRTYLLAGVLFEKRSGAAGGPDLRDELLRVLTA